MKKDEYYQSLTVALDQLTRFEPVISDQATRTPWSGFLRKQPVLHEDTNKILEMEKRINASIVTSGGRKRSITQANEPATKNNTKGRAHHEKCSPMKGNDLKKYLSRISRNPTVFDYEKTRQKYRIQQERRKGEETNRKNIFSSTQKVRPQRETEVSAKYKISHSLPHIEAVYQGNCNTRQEATSNIRSQINHLSQKLTTQGLTALQEQGVNYDGHHPLKAYQCCFYKHPYVTDELFERITNWVRTVNVSVDWASVVQDAIGEVVSYEQSLR